MSTKEQDQELSETIEIWEAIEGNDQLVVWLKELQRHRQIAGQRDELLAALEMAVEQMESDAVQIDGEWGCGWSLDEIEKAGQLPEAILKAREAIARAKGGAA